MANVYVVTTGDYSDYRIIAIFSEEKKDEAYKLDKAINDEANRVEVWALNKEVHYPTMPYYRVGMYRDGRVERVYKCDEDFWFTKINLCTLAPHQTEWLILTYAENLLEVKCYARDKDHAVKIANEYRIQLLATGIYDLLHPNGQFRFKNFINKNDIDIIITSQFEKE